MWTRRPTALLALFVAVALAAGCGSSNRASDDELVRRAVAHFGRDTARRDYGAICRDVLSTRLVARIRAVGVTCEQALERGLGSVRAPRLVVRKVKVTSDAALALVTSTAANQVASTDTLRLVRDRKGWRIDSLSGAQPPPPARKSES